MKIAFFDIISGISGDMTLGACVQAGVSIDALRNELQKLPLDGYELTLRTVQRNMIAAAKIDVIVSADAAQQQQQTHPGFAGPVSEGSAAHPVAHTHPHPHTHARTHEHAQHGHEHSGARVGDASSETKMHHGTRAWRDIRELIERSSLSSGVQQRSLAIFSALARAEAHVHGCDVEDVHFHEVGAVDSIIDIVGAAICFDLLGVERIYTSPVRTGSGGHIETQHGVMPIPAPATLELLKGYPLALTNVPYELTTPTGAAIVAATSSGVLQAADLLTVDAVGYGAGSREYPGLPNVLRILIGSIGQEATSDTVTVMECTIDDMNPELYPWVMERLFAVGALDCWLQHVLMKKGRPGHVITVLLPPQVVEAAQDVLLNETSTTGLRMYDVRRRKLYREAETVDTRFGPVRVKRIGSGDAMRRVPEFEECRRLAGERNLPLLDIYRCIEQDSNRD
jgi:pyridinium-3,5-bisthiocarboxylic acid mononucleotide nickel chelatase